MTHLTGGPEDLARARAVVADLARTSRMLSRQGYEAYATTLAEDAEKMGSIPFIARPDCSRCHHPQPMIIDLRSDQQYPETVLCAACDDAATKEAEEYARATRAG